jgi:hypothetical protein
MILADSSRSRLEYYHLSYPQISSPSRQLLLCIGWLLCQSDVEVFHRNLSTLLREITTDPRLPPYNRNTVHMAAEAVAGYCPQQHGHLEASRERALELHANRIVLQVSEKEGERERERERGRREGKGREKGRRKGKRREKGGRREIQWKRGGI